MDLRRNWATGFSILEISKFIMFSLYYKVIQPAFENRVRLCFSDTGNDALMKNKYIICSCLFLLISDSFGILVPAANMREALKKLDCVMDFSNFPKDDPMFDSKRKGLTGFLKSETCITDPIIKYVGLRAKTYALVTKNDMLESRCKGIKKPIKKFLTYEKYLRCIKQKHIEYITQYCIQSKNHVNRLMKVDKIALSSYEEKR